MFEWDDANTEHIRRHGIEPIECEQALTDPQGIDWPTDRQRGEMRAGIIGVTAEGRLIRVVFTLRRERIRAVTAWPATARQRRAYSEANQ